MVFKWLFIVFAFWWLYHVLRPWLQPRRPPAAPPPTKADLKKNKLDGQGEYIDYEEVE